MTDDFGRHLEAALCRGDVVNIEAKEAIRFVLDAVRAANAQDSAPAPVTGESPAQSVDISGAGAGVDAEALLSVLRADSRDGNEVTLTADGLRALLSHIDALERVHKAARELSAESEEYDFPDGLGRGAAQYTWDTLEDALDAIDAARKEGK